MNYEVTSQLSVRIENAPGIIATLSQILADQNVSLQALAMNEGPDTGTFRFTTSDPVAAKRSLEKSGYTVAIDEVLSIRTQDSKGRLAFLTKELASSGVNVDYMYASVDKEGCGLRLILKVSNIHLAAHVLDEIQVAA